jgi:hypothetical protein
MKSQKLKKNLEESEIKKKLIFFVSHISAAMCNQLLNNYRACAVGCYEYLR